MDGPRFEALLRTLNSQARRGEDTRATDHWFDTWNVVLARRTPRRTPLGVAIAAIANLALGAGSAGNAAKKRKKGKGKGKGRGHQKRVPACSGGACARVWSSDKKVGPCEAKCGQCKQAGEAFCIEIEVDVDDVPFSIRPICCPDGQECCVGCCCYPGSCCEPAGCLERGETCCVSDPAGKCLRGWQCCPGVGCCPSDFTCCPGRECFTCEAPTVPNPAICDCECPDGRPHCNGQCCRADGKCFSDTACCPVDYVAPFWCPDTTPNPDVVCVPDVSYVCCDGHACIVGSEDPANWVCCGRGQNGHCVRNNQSCDFGLDRYAPLATRRAGQS